LIIGLWSDAVKEGRTGLKIMHTIKNLFCYVALICNLVQEFNGLVSKGSAAMLTLLLFSYFTSSSPFFYCSADLIHPIPSHI
jgi:hypothetical protein